MTLGETIDRSSARLSLAGVSFGHGTTNAHDEAAWLVLWRLGLPLDDLDGVAARPLGSEEAAAIEAIVDERIATRKPAAYLTGEAWLQGVPFHVDARAIVPRSLIAEAIAEGTIEPWLPAGFGGRIDDRRLTAIDVDRDAGRRVDLRRGDESDPHRALDPDPAAGSACSAGVLDLCTGNGSLAVLASMAWPEVDVDAGDLSAEALAVAERNVRRHGLASRISLHRGDGFAPFAGRRYDLILCNPPYVDAEAMRALPAEYRAEPALALAGGEDGLDFIRPLLREAPDYMNDDAVLVLEIGHQVRRFEAAFPHLQVVWLPTASGDDQLLLATRDALRAPAPDAAPDARSPRR